MTLKLAIYQVLLGMLGACLINIISHWVAPIPKIATVNLTGIVQQFLQTQRQVPKAEVQHNMVQFNARLNHNLAMVAKKYHLVLVPQQAVIVGAPDVTGLVQ